jgi:hypothetical protein
MGGTYSRSEVLEALAAFLPVSLQGDLDGALKSYHDRQPSGVPNR